MSVAGGVASGKVRVSDDQAGVSIGVALGERRLWRAVFEDAVDVVHQRRAIKCRDLECERAKEWFESVDIHVGSFEWLCQLFSLDATAVREQLRRSLVTPAL